MTKGRNGARPNTNPQVNTSVKDPLAMRGNTHALDYSVTAQQGGRGGWGRGAAGEV